MFDLSDPRAQNPELVGLLAEHLGERRDFDRIAELRTGPVRLDVADRLGVDPGCGLCHGDDLGLAMDARRGVAHLLRAVIVGGGAAYDRVDVVAVAQRLLEALEYDDLRRRRRAAFPAARASNGRQWPSGDAMPPSSCRYPRIKGQGDRNAARQRDVAVVVQQAPARLVHRHERSRAGGLDGHTQAREGPACRTPASPGSPRRCRSRPAARPLAARSSGCDCTWVR